MSATSELDKNHTARDGWLTNIDVLRSLKTLNGFIDSSWCATPSFDLRAQHLQVDLPRAYSMSAISTQGAVSEKSWVSSYLVHYHNGKAFNPLTDIKGQIKEFKGNTDQSSIVRHWLMPHMYGKIVRFYPTSYVGRLCMSVEIHGCSSKDLSMWHIPREQYEKEKPIRCNLPKQPGNCMASLRKWFFNNKTRQCEPFSYGGCNGNLNNFHTEDICRQECSVFEKCKKRCSAPFSSCVKNERGEEKCECIQECPKIIEHVCGSDGVTSVQLLPTEVLFQIYKEFKGNTDPSSTVHHWLKPRLDARFVRFSPTSFTGQRCMRVELYGCKMSHLNTGSKSVTEGLGCKTKCAAPFSFCVKHKGNEEKCECIQECPYFLKQVCGSDDVTYDNECLLKKTACEKNREITIKKNGTCTGCNKNCSAPFSRCVKDGRNREKCICNQECPKILKQVCGSDFVTYGNECLLKKTACVEEKELTVLKKGACAGASTVCENGPCPPFATCVESDNGNRCACPWCSHNRTRKICGSDWRTYKNFCELKRYACENNKHISVVSRGECEVSFFEANPEEKPAKQEKSSGFMKKIYISGIAVLILGVVIAIAMCASQPKNR
ncbi:hypothetical protein pdam_00007380 [Pocillopora damicornis]|uniref:Agrin n=1 Tax=Pocillopora damicornis TaxID=46731 RepID=A0A3M6V5S7_POCDA|nr:hypothetical protein pdam_00007380 [Pocillopora damicornis]